MDIVERVYKLLSLLEICGGEIKTKKKLHKMVYLLQCIGEDFDQTYQYHFYGVFSPTLAADIDFAKKSGLILETDGDYLGTVFKLDPDYSSSVSRTALLRPNAAELAKTLVSQEPRMLEALSTIVYLHQNGHRETKLQEKLSDLKPNLKEFYSDAFELAHSLFQIGNPQPVQ